MLNSPGSDGSGRNQTVSRLLRRQLGKVRIHSSPDQKIGSSRKIGFPSECAGNGWRPGRQAETIQDLPDRVGRMDRTQDPHSPKAIGALQHINRINPAHQLRPRIVPWPASTFLSAFFRTRNRLAGRTIGVCRKIIIRGFRNDQRPPGGRRRQHPVVSNQIEPRRGHQRGEFPNQIERVKNNVTGSVPPAPFQAIQQPAIGQTRQPLGRPTGGRPVYRQSRSNRIRS